MRVLTSNWQSVTIEVLKFYNAVIGLFIGLGLLVTLLRLLYDRAECSFQVEYLAYAGVFLALFGFTFLPVERFNTARTFPTTLVFFAPFFVVGIRSVFREVARRTRSLDADGDSIRRLVTVCSVALLSGTSCSTSGSSP